MERALSTALVPFYHTSVVASYFKGGKGFQLGAFDRTILNTIDDKGSGASARTYIISGVSPSRYLHLGLAGYYRNPVDSSVRFSTRPESAVTDVRLVDTGRIRNVGSYSGIGVEAAFQSGPWSAQVEAVRTRVQTTGAQVAPTFWGGYGFISYFITGESRPYDYDRGAVRSPKPNNGRLGAWELAARYSLIDLTSEGIEGGSQRGYMLGLNWYLNHNIRVMLNAARSEVSRRGREESPQLLQARVQIAW